MSDGPENRRIGQPLRRNLPALGARQAAAMMVNPGKSVMPGLTGLPGIAILGRDSWAPLDASTERTFSPGDLIALRLQGATAQAPDVTSVLATPATHVRLYPYGIQALATKSPTRIELEVTLPPVGLPPDARTIRCAVFPWPATRTWLPRMALHFEDILQDCAQCLVALTASIRSDRSERPLHLRRGVSVSPAIPFSAGLTFPFVRAASILEPFLFSLELPTTGSEASGTSGGLGAHLRPKLVFEVPTAHLIRLYRALGWDEHDVGLAVFPNAIPVVEVDLRAWEPSEGFRQFRERSGREFISVAGVAPFREGAPQLGSDHASIPGLETPWISLHRRGRLLNYSLPGWDFDEGTAQLICWVTAADRVNGLSYAAAASGDKLKPFQVKAASLGGSTTVLPFVAGTRTIEAPGSVSDRIAVSYPFRPEVLLYPGALQVAVRLLMSAWGIRDPLVEAPRIEIRNLDGIRQRATVVRVGSPHEDARMGRAATAVQQYLQHRAPIGHRLLVESS